ncbi:MAG: RNA-binding S4 domain-containing protein [Selenomonadales bacterium]|jgi:ribosome-associated protein|nr:RNA-binding S4 domain-containing protein [Selenomonadales bacterium]
MQDERPFITLGQFLKQQSIISTGGEAKSFLLLNSVEVNGEKETRRGRKLRVNDCVTINATSYVVKHI